MTVEALVHDAEPSGTRQANPIDRYVGARIRMRRKCLRVKQEVLASQIKLTVRQLQKYERGTNRISASKLYELSRPLNVPVAYFFHGYGCTDVVEEFNETEGEKALYEVLVEMQSAELARAFARLKSTGRRDKILNLIRLLSGPE